jgi:5-methyltetrahydropteroyltriglutamate--homocysteine methyltransferase
MTRTGVTRMKHSTDRILTTHTDSLPGPADLVDLLNAKEQGEACDANHFDQRTRRAIFDVVPRQRDIGIVGDGEHSKVNWMAYARGRLRGLTELDSPVRFRGTREAWPSPRHIG